MIDFTNNTVLIIGIVLGVAALAQFALSLYMGASLRIASRDRANLTKEMFGLVRKIEGLTSNRREQMLKHYDTILEELSTRLPPTIASEAGQMIFEMESNILSRLAELEPNLREDEASLKKMDSLIKSMEGLEATLVSLTANTVRNVMASRRRDLFHDPARDKESLAA
ncbi:hypothetical protein OAO01_05435 [Oligoflexia bacterium]|nr:hypothetical protein [Oligoflexia bacterium]